MNEQANMVARYEREIPEGYEARIEGNKVIMELKDIKDTEDERIRKQIIEIVRTSPIPDNHAELLAYLEKQKEQNLEDIKDEAVRKYMKLDKFALANMLAERDKTNAETIEAFESIKEQPKQEWSEEDEKNLYTIIDSIKYVYDVSEGSKGSRLITWLKSLTERFNLQPEQKWDEEDEEMLLSAIEYVQTYPAHRQSVVDWLKSLLERFNLQPKQEWSEEDEAAFGDLMWCIEQARKSSKDENDMGDIWFAENWVKKRIKFLRPKSHWKPSEEQMETLEYYMHVLTCNEHKEILFGLYKQLKQL